MCRWYKKMKIFWWEDVLKTWTVDDILVKDPSFLPSRLAATDSQSFSAISSACISKASLLYPDIKRLSINCISNKQLQNMHIPHSLPSAYLWELWARAANQPSPIHCYQQYWAQKDTMYYITGYGHRFWDHRSYRYNVICSRKTKASTLAKAKKKAYRLQVEKTSRHHKIYGQHHDFLNRTYKQPHIIEHNARKSDHVSDIHISNALARFS